MYKVSLNNQLYVEVTVTTVNDDTVLILNPALLNYQKQISLIKANIDYYNSNDEFSAKSILY